SLLPTRCCRAARNLDPSSLQLVVDAVVIDGCPLRLSGPKPDGSPAGRPQPDPPDGLPYQVGDAAIRSRSDLLEHLELFAAETDLRLGHIISPRPLRLRIHDASE